jgi:flagellar basal-body rod modification protein FlgD
MSSTITPANGTSPLTTANKSGPASTQIGTHANNQQMNQFLTLLTAQLKNQDPMKPADPTQFVAQLAQFSTVEQLVKGNTTMTSIAQGLSGLSLGQYAGMINRTVTASATTVTAPVSGSPQNLTFHVDNPSLNTISVQLTNSAGKVVRTMPVSGVDGTVAFDGLDAQGKQLAAGQYNVALVGTSMAAATRGKTLPAGTLSSNGTVASVQQTTDGAWQLQLADGRLVAATSVTQLR